MDAWAVSLAALLALAAGVALAVRFYFRRARAPLGRLL